MQRETQPPLPPFWETDVLKWFQQAEELFRLSNVHLDDAKYALVRPRLPNYVERLLWNLLYINKPTENLYETLKNEVIRVTTIVAEEEKTLMPGITLEERGDALLQTGRQKQYHEGCLEGWMNDHTLDPHYR